MTQAYHVRIAAFDGPMDLLLHLIEKQELDITLISLAQVTGQFIEYLGDGSDIESNMLADFVAVAAKLILLKSVALLPAPPRVCDDEESSAGDLVRQLLDYKRAKLAAEMLRELDEAGLHSYVRIAPPPGSLVPVTLEGLDLATLLAAARSVLEVLPPSPPVATVVPSIQFSLPDRIAHVRRALARTGRITFRELLRRSRSRIEIIVTLLAVLEMIKRNQVDVHQDGLFGEIVITSTVPAPAPQPVTADRTPD